MQLDMHYYGTYSMARAAGLTPEACRIIATSAQFIDDNACKDHVQINDGARIEVEATAHHAADIHNILPDDQRKIWVPFHFIPGNEGDSYTERLVCRKNSNIAREMVLNNCDIACKTPYGLELLGITAHVYSDTFSHYGFSGVSSRHNKVKNDSFQFDSGLDPDIADYISTKAHGFFRRFSKEGGLLPNIKSWLGEELSGGLGHGAVATYPDRPYLKWSFEYEYPENQRVHRDNPATFFEGCAALYELFEAFAIHNPGYRTQDGRKFEDIENTVRNILSLEAKCEKRIKAWTDAAEQGLLFRNKESIPVYNADQWHEQRESLSKLKSSNEAIKTNVYRFYQAASYHRNYVLRNLLPGHGLLVK